MKIKLLLTITLALLNISLNAQTITIGTVADYTFSIFNMQDPYTRHAALYTSAQIGTTGTINSLGWNISHIWNNGDGPVKIYLKENATFLNSDSWASLKTGATVVYNGPVTFPSSASNEWFTINLTTPFNYSSGNLLVLVESNYGGSGNGGIGGDIDFNCFSGNSGYDEFWWGNPIQTTGSSSTSIPMLQLTLGTTTGSQDGMSENQKTFSIFPNPAYHSFNYSLGEIEQAELSVYNNEGKQVLTKHLGDCANGSIDISFLPVGFYTVVVINDTVNMHSKLIIQ